MWCDNKGLVLLMYLGWEFMWCVLLIAIVSAFVVCHPYIPLSRIFHVLGPSLFMLSSDSRGYSVCITDSIVSKCVFQLRIELWGSLVPIVLCLL